MSFVSENLPLFVYGAAALAAGCLLLRAFRAQRALKEKAEEASVQRYSYPLNPVTNVNTALWEGQSMAKRLRLLRTEPGHGGSVKYVYGMDDTSQLMFSSAPLDIHVAK